MTTRLVDLSGTVGGFLYTYVVVVLLVLAGLWFTLSTGAVQVRFLRDMFTQLAEKKYGRGACSISSFQALMLSTASRVGTGNIVGVSTAIAAGGPGAVFWMWLMAVVGASSAFIESTLAQIFKVRGKGGEFRGGPAYYIENGLGQRWLGIFFAILLILCFAIGFNALQAFNATSSLEYYLPEYASNGAASLSGAGLAFLAALIIFGGVRRICKAASFLVPIMSVLYLGLALCTMLKNISALPAIFTLIFTGAFDFEAIFGGFAGSAVMLGIKRGLYSNEAGLGSAPNAAATASVSHPVKQGLAQSLSVYLNTLVICSCSAMIVLVFYLHEPETARSLNGIALVQGAIASVIGRGGTYFLTLAVYTFAFSSLMGNYFYAENNFRYITKNQHALLAFRLGCLACIYLGSVAGFDLAWNLADVFMGLMAVLNLVAILFLGKWALLALNDYSIQRKAGKDPVFVAASIAGLPPTQCWGTPQS